MKNSSDTIVNRTRDIPACSAMPQLTTPLHAPESDNYLQEKRAVNSQQVLFQTNFILRNTVKLGYNVIEGTK
jgi:hypothetical protein